MGYELLGQNRPTEFSGESLRNSQVRATENDFDHVNLEWFNKCKSFEDGLEDLERGRAKTEDIRVPLDKIEAVTDSDGKFAMRIDGRDFVPTEHALNQMSTKMEAGTVYPRSLLFSDKPHPNDGAVLATIFNHQKEKLAKKIEESNRMESTFIVRTRTDGSMRAFLTAAYKPISNSWYMEVLQEYIPNGRLSHWKGDGDSIYGNILIPDTIRTEDDSDYGGMLSVGNCEIGTRRISLLPSVFRHICFNGNIWNQEMGKSLNKVHRGELNLVDYKERIRVCIHEQIPLLTTGIGLLLETKKLSTDVNIKPVLAQVSIDNKFTPAQSRAVLASYWDEVKANEVSKGTLFGVINAITRAGQTFDNPNWVKFDEIGGVMLATTPTEWGNLTARAARLKVELVDDMFALAN